MKKLIVLSILCLALTGCSSKETNTDNIALETETTVTEKTESEIVTEETEIIESENISETETTQEVDLYSEFALSGNVTKNSDGTYTITDTWRGAVSEVHDGWFSNATDSDLKLLLDVIVEMYGEDATGEEVERGLGIYKTGAGNCSSVGESTGSINETKPSQKPQGSGNSNGGNTGNSGGNSNNGGNTGGSSSNGGGQQQEQPPAEEDHGTIDFGALEQQGSNLEDGEIDIPDGIVIQ